MAKRINAPHGDKTIKLTIAFFTNGISKKPGRQLKGACLDRGFVYGDRNRAHGIATTGDGKAAFNSASELPRAVARCLIKLGIKQHLGSMSRRYIKA